MRPLGGTPCFMGQFKKHCSALVLLLNKWKKGGPRWRGRPWPGTGTPHHRVAPYALAMWTFFSPQNMPCPLCWPFMHYFLCSKCSLLPSIHPCLSTLIPTCLTPPKLTDLSRGLSVLFTVPEQCLINSKSCVSLFLNEHTYRNLAPWLSSQLWGSGMLTDPPPKHGVVMSKSFFGLCWFLLKEFRLVHNNVRLKSSNVQNMFRKCKVGHAWETLVGPCDSCLQSDHRELLADIYFLWWWFSCIILIFCHPEGLEISRF